MDIYLPIAEVPVNVLTLFAIGGGVGILSGMFGVGGGFLLTPLLIFIGIPAPVAVASQANQMVAASVTGAIAHWRRGGVDVRMGLALLAGGLAGSAGGVWLFDLLRDLGHLDTVIRLLFVVLLTLVGGGMLIESILLLIRRGARRSVAPRRGRSWTDALPLKVRFRRSRLYLSILLPIMVGFVVGVIAALMGVGGAFIMVPAMIYLLGMPTAVVVGTSLFQITFVAANVTVLQATTTHTVDVVLAFLLLVGGVVGAQIGAALGARLPGDQLRILLAALILAVGIGLAVQLTAGPADIYAIGNPISPQ